MCIAVLKNLCPAVLYKEQCRWPSLPSVTDGERGCGSTAEPLSTEQVHWSWVHHTHLYIDVCIYNDQIDNDFALYMPKAHTNLSLGQYNFLSRCFNSDADVRATYRLKPPLLFLNARLSNALLCRYHHFFICLVACLKHVATVSQTLVDVSI